MSVTPDFIGQIYKDTNTGNLWRANSLTAGDWTLEVVAKQMLFPANDLGFILKPFANGQTGVTGIHVSGISTISGVGGIDLNILPDITEASFQNLTTHGGSNPIGVNQLSSLVSISFPAFSTISAASYVFVSNCVALTSIDLGSLATISDNAELDVNGCSLLSSLALPSLQTMGDASILYIDSNAITSIAFPSLTAVGSGAFFQITNHSLLVNVSLPLVVFGGPITLDFSGCALNVASVDHILARAVASPLFTGGGFVKTNGGTSSAPSSTGPGSDYATLVARGITVSTN